MKIKKMFFMFAVLIAITMNLENSASAALNFPDSGPLGFSVDIRTERDAFKSTNTDEDESYDLTVNYLQISGHPDKEIERRINQTLKGLGWSSDITPTGLPWPTDLSPTEGWTGLSCDVECEYTLLAGRYLSARYHLYYYNRTAAHPWQSYDSKTIDLKTGREIGLTDIMAVDERLLRKLVAREFDYSDEGESIIVGVDEGVLEECDYEDFYAQINSYKRFTLGNNSIGFIVEVPHYIGDYWILAFPYANIGDLLNPGFKP